MVETICSGCGRAVYHEEDWVGCGDCWRAFCEDCLNDELLWCPWCVWGVCSECRESHDVFFYHERRVRGGKRGDGIVLW